MTETLAERLKRLWNAGGVWSSIITVTVVGATTYFITLTVFEASELGQQTVITQSGATNAPGYDLVLTGIDHAERQITFEMSSNQPVNKTQISKCLSFVYDFSDARGTIEFSTYTVVNLTEVPRHTLRATLMSKDYAEYKGRGQFAFETDLRRFPFDSVRFRVSFQPECLEAETALDQTAVGELRIRSRLKDYQLKQDRDERRLLLSRNPFLRTVAIVLLVIAFVGAVALILQARKEWPAITLLTYFIGLWGTREILQKPIEGAKAFPSAVEVTILFLFVFTICGMLAARYFGSHGTPAAGKKE